MSYGRLPSRSLSSGALPRTGVHGERLPGRWLRSERWPFFTRERIPTTAWAIPGHRLAVAGVADPEPGWRPGGQHHAMGVGGGQRHTRGGRTRGGSGPAAGGQPDRRDPRRRRTRRRRDDPAGGRRARPGGGRCREQRRATPTPPSQRWPRTFPRDRPPGSRCPRHANRMTYAQGCLRRRRPWLRSAVRPARIWHGRHPEVLSSGSQARVWPSCDRRSL